MRLALLCIHLISVTSSEFCAEPETVLIFPALFEKHISPQAKQWNRIHFGGFLIQCDYVR
jgi:hypothetical protein